MKKSYLIWPLTAAAIAGASAGFASEKFHRHGPPPEVKAAFDACFSELGVKKTEGERPKLSDEQREKMKACLKSKGVEAPAHRGPWGHHRDPEKFAKMKQCLEEAGVKLPEPGSGERPKFDDATKAAMKACREKLRGESKAENQERSREQSEE